MTPNERIKKFRKTEKGRKAMTDWNDKTRGTPQRRACYYVNWLVKIGRLQRASELNCVDCGDKAEVYDHRDYSKPADVSPVCRKCNYRRGPAKNKSPR